MNGLGPEANALLEAAREGDEPTLADRERVRGAIATRLAAGAAAGLGVATAAKSSIAAVLLAGSAAKVVVTVALVGAIGASIGAGAVMVARARNRPSPPAVSAAAPARAAAEAVAVSTEQANGAARSLPASPATTLEKPLAFRAGTRTPTVPAAVTPAHVAGDVAAEVRLLGEAHTAMRGGDAARALVLLDEHARRYPKGALGEERDAARISALCALGRTSEARDATERFLRAAPLSPHAGPVRASCGSPGTPAPQF